MKNILPVCACLIAGAMTATASVDNGLLAMAPANAQLFAGIDVQKAKTSDLGQFMLAKSQTDDLHLQQFIEKTAFDPRRDLESILMTASSNPDGVKGHGSFAVFGRGVFDEAKISAASKDGVTQTYQGVSMTVFPGKDQSMAVAFPQVGVAVMADLTTMKQIIANLATPTSFDPALLVKINAVGAANDSWFVSTTGPTGWGHAVGIADDNSGQGSQTQANQAQAGQAQMLRSIKSASGGMRFGATVDVSFDATARSAQDATSLADVFRFMASTVQMQRQNSANAAVLASSLDNMMLTTSGDTVHVSFSVPEKSLEQLAQTAPRANVKMHAKQTQ